MTFSLMGSWTVGATAYLVGPPNVPDHVHTISVAPKGKGEQRKPQPLVATIHQPGTRSREEAMRVARMLAASHDMVAALEDWAEELRQAIEKTATISVAEELGAKRARVLTIVADARGLD